jgi:chromosome segregation ATPase
VNTVLRRLDEVRASLSTAERDADQHRREAQGLEEALENAADKSLPERRTMIEEHLRAIRGALPRFEADVQRLRTEEASVTQQVALEQGRWSDINKNLDDLERALGRK